MDENKPKNIFSLRMRKIKANRASETEEPRTRKEWLRLGLKKIELEG